MELPVTTKDITVEWLNGVLHENGFLGNSNIVSLKHEQIGVGKGISSEIARLVVEYDKNDNDLPLSMAAKFPSTDPDIREGIIRNKVWENEISFYLEIAPKSPIRTPEYIYGVVDKENRFFILKDYSHCKEFDQREGMNEAQARLILLKLADYHARWWDADDLYTFSWLPTIDDSFIEMLSSIYNDAVQAFTAMDELLAKLPFEALKLSQDIAQQLPALLEKERTRNLTICHGDFRIGNIFLDEDTPSDPIIVFDWQGVKITSGARDLPWFLGQGFREGIDLRLEEVLLRLYWERLRDNGVSRYSFDELVYDYHRGFLVDTLRLLWILMNFDFSSVELREYFYEIIVRWFNNLLRNNSVDALY